PLFPERRLALVLLDQQRCDVDRFPPGLVGVLDAADLGSAAGLRQAVIGDGKFQPPARVGAEPEGNLPTSSMASCHARAASRGSCSAECVTKARIWRTSMTCVRCSGTLR